MRKLMVVLTALAAFASAAMAASTIAANRWETYVNARYGVMVDYPADLFAIDPPPPDNAGRVFTAADVKARFQVYSHANALDMSLRQLKAAEAADIGDRDATSREGADWFQILGIKNGEFILRRVVLSEGGAMVHRLDIAFPANIASGFAPIVDRMTKSFRVDPTIPEKAAAKGADRSTQAPASGAASPNPAAASAERLETGEWRISTPSGRSKDLPALRAGRDEVGDSSLGNIAFVCDRDRYYIVLISPFFDFQATQQGRVGLTEGGTDYSTSFRDLYGTRDALGRKLNWDASILYSEIPKSLLTSFADGSTLRVELPGRAWTVELKSIESRVGSFVRICEPGRPGRSR